MYITKEELEVLNAASDFIHSNTDGAEDQEYYGNLIATLDKLFTKAKKQRERQFNAEVKRLVKKIQKQKHG